MDKQPEQNQGVEAIAYLFESFAGFVPVVGSAITATVVPALRKRHEDRMRKWLNEMATEMENLKIDMEALLTDDEFFHTLVAAFNAASNTTKTEKLKVLRNAVLNCANIDSRPQDELSLRFIRLIDEMTPIHLRLMEYFDDPRRWFANLPLIPLPEGDVTQKELALLAMGWNDSDRKRLDWLLEDLTMWRILGMLHSDSSSTDVQLARKNVTGQGQSLMNFIREPEAQHVYPSEA